MMKLLLGLALLLVSGLVVGCAFSTQDEEDGTTSSDTPAGSDAIVSGLTYEEHREALNQKRAPFKGKEIRLLDQSEDTRVYWITSANGTELHSFSVVDGVERDYPAIPVENRTQITSYDVGDDWVVTAKLDTGVNTYTYVAYPANASGDPVTATFPLPTTGSAQTYDVDGPAVYILSFDETENDNVLLRWLPADGANAVETLIVFKADDVHVANLIQGLMVQDGTMVILEEGRLRRVSLSDRSALVIHATSEADALLDVNARGVLYLRDNRLAYYDFDTGDYIDVHGELEALAAIVPERETGHVPALDHGAQLLDREVIYVGDRGVFAFHTRELTARTLLLEAAGTLREEYRDPQPLSNGTIYVTALESETGSVGADGPVYKLVP